MKQFGLQSLIKVEKVEIQNENVLKYSTSNSNPHEYDVLI